MSDVVSLIKNTTSYISQLIPFLRRHRCMTTVAHSLYFEKSAYQQISLLTIYIYIYIAYGINIIVSIALNTCETVTYVSYIGSIILVSTFHCRTSHFQEEPQ